MNDVIATDPDPSGDAATTITTATSTLRGLLRRFRESSAIGLLLGIADVHNGGEVPWIVPAYLLACVALGFRHAGRAWPCWPPLGASLYLAHVAAIACGYEEPYVEPTIPDARWTLWFFKPKALGIAVGASVRHVLGVSGRLRRKAGPPVRLLPRSTIGGMAAVAGIGIALGFMRRVIVDSGTIYAAGYDEGRFRRVRIGMTGDRVETMLGLPLHKIDRSIGGDRLWTYTEGAASTGDYWQRRIYIKDRKIRHINREYWYD